MLGAWKKCIIGVFAAACLSVASARDADAASIWLNYIYWEDPNKTVIDFGGAWSLAPGDYSAYIDAAYSVSSDGTYNNVSTLTTGNGTYDGRVAASYYATYATVYVELKYFNAGNPYYADTYYTLYK